MIRWEAWCYRCRERESGDVADEGTASGKVSEFRHDHQSSCGIGVSIGSSILVGPPTVTLTGDGTPRRGGEGA